MLLYSSESKPKDGKENPLPDCPKRVRYEKKVADQEALVEKDRILFGRTAIGYVGLLQ